MCISGEGLTERRPCGGSKGDPRGRKLMGALTKQLDGAGRIVAGSDRRISIYLAVTYCRGHDVSFRAWRRSFHGLNLLEQALGDGRAFLRGRFKIAPVDMMGNVFRFGEVLERSCG